MRRNFGGDNFTNLVRHTDGPSDPSRNGGGAATVIRNTITITPITGEGGQYQTGAMVDASPLAPVVGNTNSSLNVADNDFTTGPAAIILGPYTLTSFIDFTPGAGVNATATAIAAAISRLPGFIAIPTASVVDVEWACGPNDEVEFTVRHYGTVTNFDTVTPDTGFMASGHPVISAPVLTP